MLHETLEALSIQPSGAYVDATYGRGGHCREILKSLGQHGRLFALDCDAEAILAARSEFGHDERVVAIQARFSRLQSSVRRQSPKLPIAGIVADLGVSSPQLDDARRGFSFAKDGELDMRMDQSSGISAAQWLQTVQEDELGNVLKSLGEERFAKRIARKVIATRAATPIHSTLQLADLISDCVPTRERGKHPATRVFLAIRMHINRELSELNRLLEQSVELLKQGGRLVLITFHSVEDRLVKRFMRSASIGAPGPAHLPFAASDFSPTLKIIGKALRPTAEEIALNRRARSATLRVAERLGGAS